MAQQQPGRFDNDFTDAPDAHEPDRFRNVPRWMRGDGDDINYDFMDGQRPGADDDERPRRRQTGRKRAAGGAPPPPSTGAFGDGDDDFAKFFEDAFGDPFATNEDTSSSSFSAPSELHESTGGDERIPRGARAPRGKRQKRSNSPPAGGEFDVDDKEYKMERGVNFVGQDLDAARVLNGETLRTSAREREVLRAAAEQAPEAVGGATGEGAEQFYQRCRKMMEGDDDEDAFDTDGGRLAHETARHTQCKLCRYASMRSTEIDPKFANAFDMMSDVELEKLGYAHFAQICREMRVVFNAQQQTIRNNHGEAFFVTTEEVATHFLDHDISNPLRLIGEQVTALRHILRTGRKYIFGNADGRNFWNSPKTKMFLATQKQYKDFVVAFTIMRQQLNIQQPWTKMRAPAPPGANKTKSRHLTGAPAEGRFTSPFVQ